MDETKTLGRPPKGANKRAHRIAVYLNDDEMEMVSREAESTGHTLAVLLRMRALESIRRSRTLDTPL